MTNLLLCTGQTFVLVLVTEVVAHREIPRAQSHVRAYAHNIKLASIPGRSQSLVRGWDRG